MDRTREPFRSVKKKVYEFMEKVALRKRIGLVDETLKKKRSLSTRDEYGLYRPLRISIILPTFMRSPEDFSGYRYEVIRNELAILGQLVNKGLIDEIIVIDGSQTSNGRVEQQLLRQMVSSAYRSIPLFHDQIDFLRRYPVLRDEAELGIYDLVFKVVHQLDPMIDEAGRKMKTMPEGVIEGKGAGLWLAIQIASGDVIGFFDSDLRNFEDWHVAALVKPILDTYSFKENRIEHVKAHYTRLAVNLDYPDKGFYTIGGRVTRLFMIPLIRAFVSKGVLKGLERFRYPLSGEFSGLREFLEDFEFPIDYGVETGMLIEMWRKNLIDKVSQVDLHLFQHFPQPDSHINDMVEQIARLLVLELKRKRRLDEGLVERYIIEAERELKNTQDIYDRAEVKVEVNHEIKRDFYNEPEADRERVMQYAETLRKAIQWSHRRNKEEIKKLPPWSTMRGWKDGEAFINFLKRRAVTSTVEILELEGLF